MVCSVVFWLLAVQHCGLEAAGIFGQHKAVDAICCPGGEDHCSHDGCDTVENGSYRVDSDARMIPAPQFATCVGFICWNTPVPPLEVCEGNLAKANFEHPLNWVPAWQFMQRAALSPRAPSLA